MTYSLDTLGAGRDPTQVATHALIVPIGPVELEDHALRADIELLLDVIADVADCPDHLTAEQVDAALRLPSHWPAEGGPRTGSHPGRRGNSASPSVHRTSQGVPPQPAGSREAPCPA